MKVFIREPVDGGPARGYLPLHREEDGAWHAISAHPLPTAEAAVDRCLDHLQTVTWKLAAEAQDVVDGLRRLQYNLQRLRDGPGVHDRVIVRGHTCPVAPDGSIVLPADPEQPDGSPDGSPAGLNDAGLPGEIVAGLPIDSELLDVLRRAAGGPDIGRERLLVMLGNMLDEEPTELLLAVDETAPDQLGRVARLMVAIGRARGMRSAWAGDRAPPARADSGSASGDAVSDGAVQRVIDDAAPGGEDDGGDGADAGGNLIERCSRTLGLARLICLISADESVDAAATADFVRHLRIKERLAWIAPDHVLDVLRGLLPDEVLEVIREQLDESPDDR